MTGRIKIIGITVMLFLTLNIMPGNSVSALHEIIMPDTEHHVYASNDDIIVHKYFDLSENTVKMEYSYDGITWSTCDTSTIPNETLNTISLIYSTEKGFFATCSLSKNGFVSKDGITWNEYKEDWFVNNPRSGMFTFQTSSFFEMVWCENEYIIRQDFHSENKQHYRHHVPKDYCVRFLDENFAFISEKTFDFPVCDISFADGVYYVMLWEYKPTSVFRNMPQEIYSSTDKMNWVKEENLSELPSKFPPAVKKYRENNTPMDLWDISPYEMVLREKLLRTWADYDIVAGKYILKTDSGNNLFISLDGIYFKNLGNIASALKLDPAAQNIYYVNACRNGILISAYPGYQNYYVVYTSQELEDLFGKWAANGNMYVTLNGDYLSFDDPPYIKEDRTFVPLRNIAEALNFEVNWNEKDNRITITKDNIEIILVINDSVAFINGESVTLDTPPEILNDRTYLPLRFISEALGIKVEWLEGAKTVSFCS